MNSLSRSVIVAAGMLFVSEAASAQSSLRPAIDAATKIEQPAVAPAQQNVPPAGRDAEDAVARTVRRFRVGVEGGVSLDPELIDFGAHMTFAPIFHPNVEFRPGVEFGLGELTTVFGINLDVLYLLPGSTRQTRWSPYIGAGPNFALSHKGFDDDDAGTTGNRFDFGDTDFNAGFNFIAGARNQRGVFVEMKATAYGVSNIRILAGFNF